MNISTMTALTGSQAEDEFGKRFAARLDQTTNQFPHDISERLRIARVLAVSRRNVIKVQVASGVYASGGSAALGFGGAHNLWNQFASWMPLVALVTGLMAIAVIQDEFRADEIAEVDAELLIDELPPVAYTDPGFAQYVRSNRGN